MFREAPAIPLDWPGHSRKWGTGQPTLGRAPQYKNQRFRSPSICPLCLPPAHPSFSFQKAIMTLTSLDNFIAPTQVRMDS